MRIFCGSLICFFLLFSCAGAKSDIESAVTAVCRSRVEGDFEAYKENLGGDLLRNALFQPSVKNVFNKNAGLYRKNGVLFVEVYIRNIRLNSSTRQAYISFIEKLSRGSKTVTYSRFWLLEKIDNRWRIIRF